LRLDWFFTRILRFATFEVDLRAGELRKQGKRIKVQEQPFHVLTVLLQRPGEVVTREELRSQNWPPDTFVDFDNSLNTAINKLREALGDSADSPRFIETLPRRGYRFVAPVTGADGTTRGASAGVPAWSRSRKIVAAAEIAVLAAVIAGGLLWRARQARRLTDKDTIVLGDFTNSTGDPVFDGTLREGLSVQLEQSPFLSLVSEEENPPSVADDGTTGKYTGRDAPFIGTASELLGEFESSQGTPNDFVSR
jgi:DNA-binding winged helix-turn-helix (wHTH) protein